MNVTLKKTDIYNRFEIASSTRGDNDATEEFLKHSPNVLSIGPTYYYNPNHEGEAKDIHDKMALHDFGYGISWNIK